MNQPCRIVFISGGQRSGKSRIAEQMVLSMSATPVYVATARVLDDDMERRVEVHRKRRGEEWRNVEAPLSLDISLKPGDVVLFDCLTMFATNHFFEAQEDIAQAFDEVVRQLETLFRRACGCTIVIVTNEIGLGGVPANRMQRHFADMQGQLNQWVAARAHEAWLVVSGLTLRLK